MQINDTIEQNIPQKLPCTTSTADYIIVTEYCY